MYVHHLCYFEPDNFVLVLAALVAFTDEPRFEGELAPLLALLAAEFCMTEKVLTLGDLLLVLLLLALELMLRACFCIL